MNDHGVKIDYDIGMMAGIYTSHMNESEIVRRQNQFINAHHVVLVFTKQKELTVSFPHYLANFVAKIKNERDMADVLLMVLTYTATDDDPPE